MIPQHKIEEVFETARIEEVVEDFIQLKRSGQNLKGLSPWNNEKTPSFMVSPAKQIFKDFSSGKGGNVVTFLMEAEHFSYPEAIRWLADRYNIDLEEEELDDEAKEAQNEREQLYLLNQFALKYFKEQMHETSEGKSIALGYFKEREFTAKTIEDFNLGYNPDRWDAFLNHALDQGYKEELLLTAGLVKKKGDKLFDGYKGRVMFPIQNLSGRVLGFGGRVLSQQAKTAKYINSPQSVIYDKSKTLYGLFQAKSGIVKQDEVILVEGYTDVMRLHQQGVSIAVASSGTSLTKEQVALLRRYTKNVTVLFDGDQAGLKAAMRGLDILLEEGMNVKVVPLADGEDPDSFAREKTAEEITQFIDSEKRDFINFKSHFLLGEQPEDPIKKAEAVKSVVESIALIPEAIQRSVYTKETSKLLGVEEEILVMELNKVRRLRARQQARNNQRELLGRDDDPITPNSEISKKPLEQPSTFSDAKNQEWDVLRIALNYPDLELDMEVEVEGEDSVEVVSVLEVILQALEEDEYEFEDSILQKVFSELKTAFNSEKKIPEALIHSADEDVRKVVADMMSEAHQLGNWEQRHIFVLHEKEKLERLIFGALHALQSKHILKLIDMHQKKLKDDRLEESELMALMEELNNLEKVKMAINEKLGRIII